MTESSASPEAERYLAALNAALAPVPVGTRRDIVAGVREELDGLDAQQTAERIARLGDPEFIATTALAEIDAAHSAEPSPPASASASASVPAPRTPGEARWFAVIASLLVMVGGFVIPVVGPLIGLVLVWLSRAFTRTEKWIATLTPVGLAAIVMLATIASGWVTSSTGGSLGGSMNSSPMSEGMSGLTGWHAAIIIVFATPVPVGGWLLWRASRTRSAADQTSAPEAAPESESAHTV